MSSTKLKRAVSRAGSAARWGTPDDAVAARRELAEARIEEYVTRILADAPPLTDSQRDRLAGLLRGGAA